MVIRMENQKGIVQTGKNYHEGHGGKHRLQDFDKPRMKHRMLEEAIDLPLIRVR